MLEKNRSQVTDFVAEMFTRLKSKICVPFYSMYFVFLQWVSNCNGLVTEEVLTRLKV
jgi:hypothetical protein